MRHATHSGRAVRVSLVGKFRRHAATYRERMRSTASLAPSGRNRRELASQYGRRLAADNSSRIAHLLEIIWL
jgi:hypothetical protein